MPKFRVGIWEERSGYIIIRARNGEQAKEKAKQLLGEHGCAMPEFDQTHSDRAVISIDQE